MITSHLLMNLDQPGFASDHSSRAEIAEVTETCQRCCQLTERGERKYNNRDGIPSETPNAFIPADTILWKDCKRVHSNATFSADGNKIAIYTSYSQRQSELRFLLKSGQRWIESRNPLLITVISGYPDTQLGDKCIKEAAMCAPMFFNENFI
jgi:hypothetical protein